MANRTPNESREAGRQAGKKEMLKAIIRDLHAGLTIEEGRERFRREVGTIGTRELVEIEQSLIDEGLPPEEVARFCNVHALLVRDSLEEEGSTEGSGARPLEMLRRENAAIRAIVAELRRASRAGEAAAALASLAGLDRHYALKENVIFPNLERNGFPGPSKVMWQKDDEIRALLKKAAGGVASLASDSALGERTRRDLIEPLADEVEGMVEKEERILFPAAAERLDAGEWARAAIEMDEMGWAFLAAGEGATEAGAAGGEAIVTAADGMVQLPSGRMAAGELEAMLNALPLDVTFVDADDRVRYFSEGRERIFARTRSVIGRTVQNCHPPRSLAAVQRVLDSFRAGTADHHDFWIRLGEKTVSIRYFALRDAGGRYLGTLEVTQDITQLQALRGEKRLLD